MRPTQRWAHRQWLLPLLDEVVDRHQLCHEVVHERRVCRRKLMIGRLKLIRIDSTTWISMSTHSFSVHQQTFHVEVHQSLRPSSLDCVARPVESRTMQFECSSVGRPMEHRCTVSWPSLRRFVAQRGRLLCLQCWIRTLVSEFSIISSFHSPNERPDLS